MIDRAHKNFIQLVVLLLISVGAYVALKQSDRAPTQPAHESTQDIEVQGINKDFQGKLLKSTEGAFSEGYILYPVVGTAQVLLLDMKGKVRHLWNVDAQRARLLPNGNLLVVHGTKWGANVEPWKTLKFHVREYSWEGDIVWDYKAPGRVHHDIALLENNNLMFPYRTVLSEEKKSTLTDPKRRNAASIRTDRIIEVNRDKKIVWEWVAEDHLDVNSCGKPSCDEENPADWSHINTVSIIPPNKWFSSGDTRFRPGNVLTLFRNWWTAMIVDKENGEVVWSYTGDYKGGLSGGHEASMIENNFPGAGNILVFDNGRVLHKGESYVLEINPTTKKLDFIYDNGKDFFSNSAGSVARLRDGNTFISEDLKGRIFEINSKKETVWEYKGNLRIARAKKYEPDHCPQLASLSNEAH